MEITTNAEELKMIRIFSKAPQTQEKEELSKKYLTNKIDKFEFASLVKEYLDKNNISFS